MKKVYFLFVLFFSVCTFAQEEVQPLLPEGLGLSLQSEYSYDVETKQEIFENWLNADYTYGIFSAGIRFDVFEPNDPSPAVNRGKTRYADISYKYLKATLGDFNAGADFTVGNFYAAFGRGMILKSYEDRSLRIDNNLLGVKFSGRYADFAVTALTGMPENTELKRSDVLHAVDIEYRGLEFLPVALTYASNRPDIDGAVTTELGSFRIAPHIWQFDFYGEYGIKKNSQIQQDVFNNSETYVGDAFYGSMTFYEGGFSLTSEYKYYDNFLFGTADGTVQYNTPPAVRKDYTYLLLNRHPSPLNQANEQGYRFEGAYYFENGTNATATYGITKTLPSSSYYQRIMGSNLDIRTQYKEAYGQIEHPVTEDLTLIGAAGYSEELDGNTKNITGVLDAHYTFEDVNTMRAVWEHQATTNRNTDEQYYTDVLLLEYQRSPSFSLSFVAEMRTTEPEAGKNIRKLKMFVEFGYTLLESTDIRVLVGSREAGTVCIGGVCRYEPEFRGIEVKLQTRL